MFRLKTPLLDEESGAAGGSPSNAGAPPAEPAAPPDWKASLPEGVRDWQEVETSKSPEDFYKQMEHYRSAYGRSIRVPGEDAGPEDRAKFLEKMRQAAPELVPAPDVDDEQAMDSLYATLGRPEKADDYRMPEGVENLELDQGLLKVYKDAAHKSGLSQKQMESVMSTFLQAETEMLQAQEQRLAEGNANLQQEWGLKYDQNRKSAATIAERFGFTQDVVNAIESGAMGEQNMKAWLSIAQGTGNEGANLTTERGAVANLMTPEEAQLQIDEIRKNKEHAYWHPGNPAHKSARKKMRELHVMAQGNNNREVSLQAQTAGIGGGINYGE